eukprot:12273031-Prorocentrum_lima.AAC.1
MDYFVQGARLRNRSHVPRRPKHCGAPADKSDEPGGGFAQEPDEGAVPGPSPQWRMQIKKETSPGKQG